MPNGIKSKINWIEAKKYYLSDPTIALVEVADKFGVSHTVMHERASKEGWVEERRKVLVKADAKLSDKAAETIADIKIRHAKMGRTLQGRGLEVIATRKPETFEEARLSVLSGIKIEREALGLDESAAQDMIYQKFQQFSFIFTLSPDELRRFITAVDARIAVSTERTGSQTAIASGEGDQGELVDSVALSG